MSREYCYEPTTLEVLLSDILQSSVLRLYYARYVKNLGLKCSDKVLDYCCGSRILSYFLVRELTNGELAFADVSCRWVTHASHRLKGRIRARSYLIRDFSSKVLGGNYDKILIHFAVHDFPDQYQPMVINHAVANLKAAGELYIREPIGREHGIQLFRLVNMIEATNKLKFTYNVIRAPLLGEMVDLTCRLVN